MYYRVRGYQFKSEKGESRKNPAAYRSLDDAKEKLAEAALPSQVLTLRISKSRVLLRS